jgi:hypothetical protein
VKSPAARPDAAMAERWRSRWPEALKAWGPWTRLPDPEMAATGEDVRSLRLEGVLAQFSMESKGIQVNLPELCARGLQDFPMEILAHEVGHHVLAPGDLTTHFRILAQIRRGLPTLEARSGEVANLWTDILVNDRLFRNASLPMDKLYVALGKSPGIVWAFYMRLYERLWELEKGSLYLDAGLDPDLEQTFQADTWLGARTARVYADDPVRGAGRFAALLLPWLLKEKDSQAAAQKAWMDGRRAAQGSALPSGLGRSDDDEPILHPSEDPAVSGEAQGNATRPPKGAASMGGGGQWREPWEYRELLALGGLQVSETEAAARYYRERALPHLVNTPRITLPKTPDPLPEGLDPWEIGDSIENLDMFQSVMQSPALVPGVTTVSRHWGEEPGRGHRVLPLDLDLYVDSSGSMPNPGISTSYAALAGAIVAMSTLRRGGSVQVTLWSGKRQCLRTEGFIRDEDKVLLVLCSHFGGSTAFPLHALRETWASPRPGRKAHILHISDDGLSTMFDRDELGNSGWDLCARALKHAAGGGTMVLQMHPRTSVAILDKARDEQGWAMHRIKDWKDLMEFAVRFSQTHSVREAARL